MPMCSSPPLESWPRADDSIDIRSSVEGRPLGTARRSEPKRFGQWAWPQTEIRSGLTSTTPRKARLNVAEVCRVKPQTSSTAREPKPWARALRSQPAIYAVGSVRSKASTAMAHSQPGVNLNALCSMHNKSRRKAPKHCCASPCRWAMRACWPTPWDVHMHGHRTAGARKRTHNVSAARQRQPVMLSAKGLGEAIGCGLSGVAGARPWPMCRVTSAMCRGRVHASARLCQTDVEPG